MPQLTPLEKLGIWFLELYASITSGKFGGESKLTESISESIAQYKELLSHLETQQLGALTHLIFLWLILSCLVSIIFIFYGEFFIVKLNIETKYPRLAVFIRLRRKFQQFYFLSNISMIVFSIFILMYVNLFILFHS